MPQLTIADAFALALRCQQEERISEAVALYQQITAIAPDHVEAHYNLGLALKRLGRVDEAIAECRAALALRPAFADAWLVLGNALADKGRSDESIEAYRSAIANRPDYAQAYFNLAAILHRIGQMKEAIDAYRHALSIAPDMAEAHQNLGNALRDVGRVDEAIAAHRHAQALLPQSSEVEVGLGNALRDSGRAEEAIAAYRRALELGEAQRAPLKSQFPIAGNLLFTLNFVGAYDRRRIWREHQWVNERLVRPARLPQTAHRSPGPAGLGRRLRVGYVSPDFSQHPVGRFMLPLLANHDHRRYEVFCYSDVRRPDHFTERLRAFADTWRDTSAASDAQLEQTILSDQIDILVDLAMHTRDSRLLVFARKPAPVQVAYLAYCGTTGLEAMDYRLTDPYLDPPSTGSTGSPQAGSGQAPSGDDSVYSETSIRLPNCFWCFQAEAQGPEVSNLPALATGRVTFGCFNNYCKVNSVTFAAWIDLLKKVPNSRLVLFAEPGEHRTRAWQLFREAELDPERLWFTGFLPAREYVEQYRHIDIALDPFPYPGGTTTFDALWMGVPVVSLAGETAVSRAGLSILSNIGLPELVATSIEQYVAIAAGLASALPRLAELRSGLRDRMKRSPLMDAPRFARDVEGAFDQMWERWCQSGTASA
jgi:predicted O-linked N-acetylglucosamine transferase (SPINDLY family)